MSTFEAVHEPLLARDVILGRTTHVRRLMPNKNRRMVGAWCFLDHYGPAWACTPTASARSS
jgi:hypothetical protein